MPTPSIARYKVSFLGVIHGAPWQTGCWFKTDNPGPPFQVDLDNWLVSLESLGAAWKSRWQTINSSQCVWNALKLDFYQASSLAVAVTSTRILTAPVTGSVTTESSPASSLVATLNTAHAGRSGRGRMYWPATGAYTPAGSPAGWPGATVIGAATDLSAYLTAINAINSPTTTGDLTACVQSTKDGQLYPITGVTFDGRPDAIEHRERRLTYFRSSHVVS